MAAKASSQNRPRSAMSPSAFKAVPPGSSRCAPLNESAPPTCALHILNSPWTMAAEQTMSRETVRLSARTAGAASTRAPRMDNARVTCAPTRFSGR
jgi:hypothetical protein